MQEAHENYIKGETANTLPEKRNAFNRALRQLTSLENAYDLEFSSGKLYYNIANTYFHLREYPMAILYYHRAIRLMPRAEKPKDNLSAAQKKLGIQARDRNQLIESLIPNYFHLSLPERLQLFFTFSLCSLFFCSLFLWQKKAWMQKLASLSGLLAAVILLLVGYGHYFDPIKAVVVNSTVLRRDAGTQYANVREQPILSGDIVEVLDIFKNGRWVKVITREGDLGYVPNKSIRVI